MGNLLSNSPSGAPQQGSTSNSNIQGDHSGNTDSNNTTYNNYCSHGKTSYPEILQHLYTSAYRAHWRRVREPVEGTCSWVTEHPRYKDWLGKETSGLLWLSADPGCGKSVIASFLVTHLKSRTDAIVCYFFFKDDSKEQRSATFALCAILHQLFVQRESLWIYAKEAFTVKGERFAEEVDTLWDILVKAVSEGGCGDVICVVDALDECEEVTIAPLIRYVTRLPESRTSDVPLKFFVTSRPYHRIERELGSRATTIRLKGEDEVGAITTDVNRVIDDGVKELESVWENPGGLGYLRVLLQSSADRTFLWVSLILEILRDSVVGSRGALVDIVSTAPANLDELYTKILSKSTDYDRARKVLGIVVAATRPLTIVEMNIALTVGRDHKSVRDLSRDLYPTFEKTVKNLCGLFVRIIDSKVYLVHQTAREFLMKRPSLDQGNWWYSLSSEDSNYILADICISYLSLGDFENDPFVIDPEEYLGEELASYKEKYALLDYAATHWAGHFGDSLDQRMKLFEFARLICKGGSKRFATWLNIYWRHNCQSYEFPHDFTHLMIASWLGQQTVVHRLLEEGEDINARSEQYGTALNVAVLRRDKDITRILVESGGNVYLCGKECNLFHAERSELVKFEESTTFEERLFRQALERRRRALFFREAAAEERAEERAVKKEKELADFLEPLCIQDPPDSHASPSVVIAPLSRRGTLATD